MLSGGGGGVFDPATSANARGFALLEQCSKSLFMHDEAALFSRCRCIGSPDPARLCGGPYAMCIMASSWVRNGRGRYPGKISMTHTGTLTTHLPLLPRDVASERVVVEVERAI